MPTRSSQLPVCLLQSVQLHLLPCRRSGFRPRLSYFDDSWSGRASRRGGTTWTWSVLRRLLSHAPECAQAGPHVRIQEMSLPDLQSISDRVNCSFFSFMGVPIVQNFLS